MRYAIYANTFSIPELGYDARKMRFVAHDTQTNSYFNIKTLNWERCTATSYWVDDLEKLLKYLRMDLEENFPWKEGITLQYGG